MMGRRYDGLGQRVWRVLASLTIGVLWGCSATATGPNAPMPDDLALKLQASTVNGRYTYFELSRQGELRFGGGKDATNRLAGPVTTLSEPQRRRVWQIIREHGLLQARGSLFAKAATATYELDLTAGGQTRSFRAVDDQVKGLKALHDHLFELQAAVRYTMPRVGTGQG